MAQTLITVEQAADRLKLHPKTVLRYVREGRLPATRIGKSYRIEQTKLEAFAGVASGHADAAHDVRATCIVDLPGMTASGAGALATFLNAAAMTGDAGTPPLHISTAFNPHTETLKVVIVGTPADTARLLEMIDLHLGVRP